MSAPVYSEYFADPFVLHVSEGDYVAYGTGRPPATGDAVFEAITSADLTHWASHGPVLPRLPAALGDEYWAPEVVESEGSWWLYYSVGKGIVGHHLRVARAEHPLGPFVDQGVNLTPDESFAIDAHPFRDLDGTWYLFFARDVLDHPRPGTHLAVVRLSAMDAPAGPPVAVLEPDADWQIFERGRSIYNSTFDWHTLEGPTVIHRAGRYWMTYSGGAWTGDGYAVSWAVADSIAGPWSHAPQHTPPLLSTNDGLIGPGHNSLAVTPRGDDVIVFHSWDADHDARKMHVLRISFRPEGPCVGGPTQGSSTTAIPT